MLTISKKAASEAECELICAASYTQETPFGQPVIIIDPKQFPPAKSLFSNLFLPPVKVRATRHIFKKMAGILNKDPEFKDFGVDMMRIFNEASVGSMVDIIETSQHLVSENNTTGVSRRCELPGCTIIVCNKGKNAGSNLFRNYMGIIKDDLPGYDSQWHTMILWHEIGHACRGLSEEKADQLSALVCRYAFADFSFLSAWADFRMIQPIIDFEHKDAKLAHQYPVNTAFIIDNVVMDKKEPTWQDIANTVAAPQKPIQICSIADSLSFAKKLKQQDPDAFQCRQLFRMASAAKKLMEERRFETMGEFCIAARFALAGFRLCAGLSGYPKSGTMPSQPLR